MMARHFKYRKLSFQSVYPNFSIYHTEQQTTGVKTAGMVHFNTWLFGIYLAQKNWSIRRGQCDDVGG